MNYIQIRKIICLIFISYSLIGCIRKKNAENYPVINLENNAGIYQRSYCSDFFSSLKLIQLETKENSLVGEDPIVLLNDSLIFISSVISYSYIPPMRNILVFNLSGKFLNQIGRIGHGPGEYQFISDIFLNTDELTIFVNNSITNYILEYDFNGKFVSSIPIPNIDGQRLSNLSYVKDNLFIGAISTSFFYGNSYKYCLFDRKGNIVKHFSSYFTSDSPQQSEWFRTMVPFRVDKDLYLKDFVNDTLYTISNLNLQPVYVFNFGKYAYPLVKINEQGQKEIKSVDRDDAIRLYMKFGQIVGTPKYFFYNIIIPKILPRPKARKGFLLGREVPTEEIVYGIFDIEQHTNTLLDTDQYFQKGIINDMDGGLPFFPRYYAGNGEVVDIWQAADMKEMLTEEYFAEQPIKDKHAHQKLKELLKNLKDDDNPVVVVAKLK